MKNILDIEINKKYEINDVRIFVEYDEHDDDLPYTVKHQYILNQEDQGGWFTKYVDKTEILDHINWISKSEFDKIYI